jgi:hypothetical protein
MLANGGGERNTRVAIVALALVLLPIAVPAADSYVELTADRVAIRASPASSSALIGYGKKGDIFKLAGKQGALYELYLFSGEARYVPLSQARLTTFVPSPPSDLRRRRELFSAFVRAEDRAMADADKKYPPVPVEPFVRYQRMLDDRYKLEVVRAFEVQPVVYSPIKIEGAKALWR